MALTARVMPRARREINKAADWWLENRPAAPGAVDLDLRAAIDALVEQPGISMHELLEHLAAAGPSIAMAATGRSQQLNY